MVDNPYDGPEWSKLVEQELQGADPARLEKLNPEAIRIKPAYGPQDVQDQPPCQASSLLAGVSTPPCTPIVPGQFANMPVFPQQRKAISFTVKPCLADKRDYP